MSENIIKDKLAEFEEKKLELYINYVKRNKINYGKML